MMPMRMTGDMGFARKTLWPERSTVHVDEITVAQVIALP
jgi:hypothetical protein